MNLPPPELKDWEREQLFDAIPMSIAAIDHDFNIIHANLAFERIFGAWRNRKCFDVYKNRDSLCPTCTSSLAFKDGKVNISDEQGYDKDGRTVRYIKHIFPMTDQDGNIPYLIEMSTDITESEQMRREYQLLFDQVPCHVLLINKDMRIVKANQRTKEMLGDIVGSHCYESLKGQGHVCGECTALQTFADGLQHSGHHIWKSEEGATAHMHVITVPLRLEDGSFDVVMEMAVDVTHTLKLEDGLKYTRNYLQSLITASRDGIFALDRRGKVTVFNPSARKIFNTKKDQIITKEDLSLMLPKGFLAKVTDAEVPIHLPHTELKTVDGKVFPGRLTGNRLFDEEDPGKNGSRTTSHCWPDRCRACPWN
jgi:PAS domain S-box-containing protein